MLGTTNGTPRETAMESIAKALNSIAGMEVAVLAVSEKLALSGVSGGEAANDTVITQNQGEGKSVVPNVGAAAQASEGQERFA